MRVDKRGLEEVVFFLLEPLPVEVDGQPGRCGGNDIHGTAGTGFDGELIDGFGAVGVELGAVAKEVEHGASLKDVRVGLDMEGDGLSESRERERRGVERPRARKELFESDAVESLFVDVESREGLGGGVVSALTMASSQLLELVLVASLEENLDGHALDEDELAVGAIPAQRREL